MGRKLYSEYSNVFTEAIGSNASQQVFGLASVPSNGFFVFALGTTKNGSHYHWKGDDAHP